MFRALWFFVQISIVVAAAIWIATQQGAVDIAWRDYTLSVQLGIFLLAFVSMVVVGMLIFWFVNFMVDLPNKYSRHKGIRAREKGYQSLTRGFVAIAAGDAKKATQYAKEVRHLIPDERGLPLLLEAQAARLRGEEDVARHSFEELLKDKDAAFFGIRGLLKSSLEAGDIGTALGYAKTALAQNPKQPWILKSVYDLELQNGHWHDAIKTLERVKKFKAIDDAQATKDEIALLLLLADEDSVMGRDAEALKKSERAVKLDPSFVPAVLHLGELYLARGKAGKVSSIVERAWKINPHPELALLWDKVAPENKTTDTLRRLRWHEKLAAMRPDSIDGQVAVAMVAMEDGLWGEAKTYLVAADAIRPSSQIFRLRAKLEEQTTRNDYLIKDWLEKAADGAADPVWYCTLTGNIYDHWSPIALPHGSFNTIAWGYPVVQANTNQVLENWKDPLMIENA